MGNIIFPKPDRFTAQQVMDDPILRYFHFAHLPPALREISEQFCNLAAFVIDHLPRNVERSVALRKLLEAKDAAVRANVPDPGVRSEAAALAASPSPLSEPTKRMEKILDVAFVRHDVPDPGVQSETNAFPVEGEIKTTGGEHSETPIPFDD